MGSWNKTCGLTQMPIFSGEEVVTFYLIENPFRIEAMTSYSSGYWSYIPLPFYGTYDDYGFLDMKDGQDWKLQELKKAYGRHVVIDKPDPENKTSIDQWTVDETVFDDYEKLKEAIHRRRLHVNLYGEKDSSFGFVMFEKKTFDMLTAPYKPEKLVKILKEFKEFYKERTKVDEVDISTLSDKEKEIAAMKAAWRFLDGAGPHIDAFCESKKITGWDSVEKWFLNFWFDRFTNSEATGFGTSNFLMNFRELMYGDDSNIDYRELADGYLANIIMSRLRKQWYPAGHEGSQDELNPDHKVFMKAFKQRHSDITHRWDEYD